MLINYSIKQRGKNLWNYEGTGRGNGSKGNGSPNASLPVTSVFQDTLDVERPCYDLKKKMVKC